MARAHLSLVPEPIIEATPEIPEEDQWQERALCAQTDPEAFFPEKGGSTREAKRICLGCEVRDACLDYALAHDERFGIWGGLSERERRRLKRGII
ncbi:WhiB family transcriptional regulator [Mycobacterium sp. CVI_P3]|uniref:Transcriptional regulator WhiB n=2 Tax=Mycobacterium pinniadriaticum TaxID=2994102 RepID=A0ABT3SMB5_9MYCO|nr:WhiB family transcriptional regulator [Mycobacterium pinniadriaticum]MCX2940649.1 WhiB family transcriptional regulator [Mycobacterium pinniadriaticum]